ncbi:helix-turn-helix transcriptional regulator [Flavobacterium sp.]|uniref:helix-turn-helix transcriptional regulator n=1 Tax=Flavobacterium sp. TaxID=239 RepID=UPI0037BE91E8
MINEIGLSQFLKTKITYFKIKEIRENHIITNEYIAVQVDLSIKKYTEIEKGNVDLKISKLKQIVDVLNVRICDFFEFLINRNTHFHK